ncbi:CmcJ/NvfI family oxidoreductase [Burkholderia oklahomensis]|uniref:Methyltransferase n=1 Tax=Burkholderia oklahomensis TaxID=342113 RepID=A0AAI8BBT4_9BURK|nr:CmcJ/NvfI family oxidoreductase [Burkholderia oklahomensis]AIO69356.1 putative methyltransferase [Burkholderia oklahomensis]AOI39539.1 methyltransferase [Burkholderia oklahomensis EO147]KUY51471.1 methyltransferase [Burkholderia oklahomensis EO147]QPS40109.1 methyltransferase [Burkholderia oklahomensis]
MSTVIEERPPVREGGEIEAEVNYLAKDVARPVSYMFEPPPGTPWATGELEPRRVKIRDARPLAAAGALGLDASGFELVAHRTALADFADDAAIRSIYYAEVDGLLRAATGAEKVVIFDHTLRDSAHGSRATSALREPVRRVHNDQTFVSAPRRVRDHLPADEAEARLRQRFAIVNVWRPLDVVERLPLALCDARTIAPDDLVPSDLVYRDKIGETYSVVANPAHRWFYFPRLRADETLLLKIYDSLDDGRARLTAHTAFDDPTTRAAAAPRRSIEVRALVFWPAAA